MSELKGACIFGQSGGPTSVINASAYGVIATALKNPSITRVLGAEHGIKGVLNDRLFDMGQEDPTQAASRKTICSRTGHSCLRIASKSTDISTTSYIFVGDGWVVFLWFSFTGEATSLQSTDFLRSNAIMVKNYQLWSWENRL